MRKVVVISALCMGGVGLMAFKPFKVHTVPLNDITAIYNAGNLFKSMEAAEFEEFELYGSTSDKEVYAYRHKRYIQKSSSPSSDKVEQVLNKY